jgi:hypothetical protein
MQYCCLFYFICCVARALFMIFSALPVPHTLQATISARPVALRCRHLWWIFLIWKYCISTVSFFDGAGCLLWWLFLLVILCCCFELDVVVREGALLAFVLWFCDILIVCCDANFVVVMSSTPPPPCSIAAGKWRMQYCCLFYFICCVARAVFMIFSALPVPHTSQTTPSARPVALRCRHLWCIFLIWKICVSAVSLFDGAGCLLRWLFLLVILCCCFELDIVVREGALIAFGFVILWYLDFFFLLQSVFLVCISRFKLFASSFYDNGPLLVSSFQMGSLQSKWFFFFFVLFWCML